MTPKEAMRWLWKSKAPKAQRTRQFIKLIILVALFIVLYWVVPFDQVIRALASADPLYLVVGMVLGFVSIFLTAVQIEPLTRNQGIKHSIGQILAINLVVKFYLQFTPGTLVGSGIRWYRLAQPGGKFVEALVALAFFRVLETFITLSMGLGFWLLSGEQTLEVSIGWLLILILGIILAWVLITRYSLAIYAWFKSRAAAVLNRPHWELITGRVEKFLTAVTAYANLPAFDLLLSISAGIGSALAGIASGVFLAQAVGIELSFLDMGWIQAIVLFATQLPFTVAGGVGVREVTLVAILPTLGVSAELALALSLLMFLRSILIGLCGGIIEAYGTLRRKSSSSIDPYHGDAQES